ncbi:MAG: serine protease [Deltaproteobacteria bacterium]|jgi:S1-C subfamily serine protease|nr:serine protease [Deltaproteobacteria bacterium]
MSTDPKATPPDNQAPPAEVRAKKRSCLIGLLLGLLMAALFLGLIYYFFYSRYLYRSEVAQINPGSLQTANIDALKSEVDRYRGLLSGNVCAVPAEPRGPFAAPLTEPDQDTASPDKAAPAEGASAGSPPDDKRTENSDSLLDDIEKATVLVLALGDEAISMGTGFFIGPNLILTNRHVIEIAKAGGPIMVTNKSLGHIEKAELVSVTRPDTIRDYAVLKTNISPSNQPKTLKFSREAKRADRVSAWGYPGLLTKGDPKMDALMEGDFNSVPELVYAEGVISVIQEHGSLPLINHTAEISQGNSGGPLINQDGQVIGINTLIRVDDESNRQVNIAFGVRDVIQFLTESSIRLE